MTAWLTVVWHERLALSTWRRERYLNVNLAPINPCLSFDGTTWVSIDSLANEPQTGQPNRTPK